MDKEQASSYRPMSQGIVLGPFYVIDILELELNAKKIVSCRHSSHCIGKAYDEVIEKRAETLHIIA